MGFDYADRYIEVDDMVVRYWDEGEGEPVLLIHGMGACMEVWAWNIDALASRHRVIALDLPGSGKSSRPALNDDLSLEYGAEFLCRFVERLGLLAFSVAGNSMGGALALQLTLMSPALVRSLILVDSGGLGREVHWVVRLASVPFLDHLAVRPPPFVVSRVAEIMLCRRDATTEELIRRATQYFYVPGTISASLRMARTGVNVRGQKAPHCSVDLATIAAPTLVIWGEKDRVIPVQHAEAALRAIPDCRAVVMHDAGHGPQIDRPDVFNALVLEFLSCRRLAAEQGASKRLIQL